MKLPERPSDRRARDPRGQGLVEFALILPVLVLLLVMSIDFGRVFFGWVALQNATRIAADIAAGQADSWPADNPAERENQDHYRRSLIRDLTAINCTPLSGGSWQVSDVPDPVFRDVDGDGDAKGASDHASVTLECRFTLITPLAQTILGGPVAVGGAATFAINYVVTADVPSMRPLPTPTPTPAPTPAPTNCTIPNYVTLRANDAQNLWNASPFTGGFTRSGSGNFTIVSQSLTPPGAPAPCNSSMTVSAAPSTATPTPTPSGTAPTPTPAPTCAAPIPNFSANPTSGTKPLTVQFTDTSGVIGTECPITAWSWNFGDGSSADPAQNPSHVFTFPAQGGAPRTFAVTLTVTNAGGSTTSAPQTITVSP